MNHSAELDAASPPNVRLLDRPQPRLERVFDVDEAAAHLRIKRGAVEGLIRRGLLESFQPYVERRLISESQLARFIARASNDPANTKGATE